MILAIGLALALLPLAGSAVARAERVAVSGESRLVFGTPARVWVADGWTHFRGFPLTGSFAYRGDGVTLAGTFERLDNATFNAAGQGRVWGVATFRDAATGVTCTGPSPGSLTQMLFAGTVVARCSDGALLTGTIRDTGPLTDGAGQVIGVVEVFRGVLLTPGR
jgi:hypothetical protein